MNIHCSACGAPLTTGATSCPNCALPLTAIAMPTPAPRRKQVSILAILFGAFAILWVVAYASDAHDSAKAAPIATSAPIGIDQTLEQNVEQADWFAPQRLRTWRSEVAKDLADLQQRPDVHEAGAQDAVAADKAALASIDARLRALKAAR